MIKKILSAAAVLLLLAVSAVPAYASDSASFAEEIAARYADANDTGIIAVSRKGNWREYPENSVPAAKSAAELGADMIEIDIRRTADGVLILSDDDNLYRMCDGADATPVSELDYTAVKGFNLRNSQGEKMASVTQYRIATLTEMLDLLGDRVMFLLDFPWELREDVYNTVSESGRLGTVVFLCRADTGEISEWTQSLDTQPMTMAYKKTNIVFSAISTAKAFADVRGSSVLFASSNPYGVIFHNTVMKYIKKSPVRAAICTADKLLCGKRLDTEGYWNNLVALGYSIIITDYIEQLSDYSQRSIAATQELKRETDYATETWEMPDFDSYVSVDYKVDFSKAVEQAESLLNDSGVIGEKQAREAIYALEKSIDNVETNYSALLNGKAGVTVSVWRILWALFAVAAVLAAEIYTYKKRRKKK